MSRSVLTGLFITALLGSSAVVAAPPAGELGPYNLTILQGGVGMARSLPADSAILAPGAPWSVTGWIRLDISPTGPVVVAAVGDPASGACICLVADAGDLGVNIGADGLHSGAALPVGDWQAIAATYDGAVARLYLGGLEVGQKALATHGVSALLHLGPVTAAAGSNRHFGGSLAEFQFFAGAAAPDSLQKLAASRPAFDLIHFTAVGVGWPPQVRAWIGLTTPQDPWTLPHAAAPASRPVALPVATRLALRPDSDRAWTLDDWRQAAAPEVREDGGALSQPGYDDAAWYAATVPGTVLTTLIDRGVYPDPDYGLNNMAIPESLGRQDYWYRTAITPPVGIAGKRLTLIFKGINYAAEVWLNGAPLGSIKGAFIRGVFDVTARLTPGKVNALAVRVSPPPHPGIPSEESIAAGPGENGGSMALDGPTFLATEGWDWIPGIRDRNTGLWQAVELQASGPIRIQDPTVISRLSLPKLDAAQLQIVVPLENAGASARQATVEAAFEGVQ